MELCMTNNFVNPFPSLIHIFWVVKYISEFDLQSWRTDRRDYTTLHGQALPQVTIIE